MLKIASPVIAYHDGSKTRLSMYGHLTNTNVRIALAQALGLKHLGDMAILWRIDGSKVWHSALPRFHKINNVEYVKD